MNTKLIILKMKFYTMVLSGILISSQLLIAKPAESQISKSLITISFGKTSLKTSISELEKKSKVKFSYNTTELRKITVKPQKYVKEELGVILKNLLASTNLRFREVNNGIVIYPEQGLSATESLESNFSIIELADIIIKGKVSDDQGALPGVSVKVEGAAAGVVTDVNGNFTITAPENATLVFSYVGYNSKRIPVNNQQSINVVLEAESKSLEEVVVVGYGTQKKVNLTGAVSAVSGEELISRQAPNTSSLLQGRMPGVQVIQNSGQPGAENASIQIRGKNTFSAAGNDPLVLIDGIEGNLNNVNPNNIESISVLKDAASASIYGSRAANGVVLVTTKAGKEGRLNVDYTYNFNSQRPTSMYDRVTNSVQYMELKNSAIAHVGSTVIPYTTQEIESFRVGSTSNPEQFPNYDWMDAIFSTAPLQQHFLSVNGGKSGTTYNFGLGFLDQKGILIATDYKRYDAQFNLKTNLSGKVTFGTNISFSKGARHETALNGLFDGNTTEDQILSALAAAPMYKPKLPDGSGRYTAKGYNKDQGNKNPVAVAENGGRDLDTYYGLASAFLNVDILPGLKGEIKGGLKYTDRATNVHVIGIPGYFYQPDASGNYLATAAFNGTVGENNLQIRNEKDVQLTYFAHLNYIKKFGNVHNFNALLGASQETFRYDRLHGFKRNAPTSNLTEFAAYAPTGQTVDGHAWEWAIQSLFGRVNYNLKEKYLFEANFRYDGSSRFSPGNKWGFFPSASLGWRLSEESFLKSFSWIDNLKPRASWGQVGNQNIDASINDVNQPYPYQSFLNSSDYQIDGSLQQALYLSALNNRNIKWETTTLTNVGLDFGFLNSKIFGSVDWYTKNTTDILRTLQVPQSIGLSGPTVNQGEMRNTGIELLLGHENRLNGFHYKIQGNFETYKNKLVKYGAREINAGSGTIRQEGLPLDSYFMYVFDGIYQNQAEITSGPTPLVTPKPGDMKYKDVSGPNGVPDGKITVDDRTLVDGAFPKFNYGFSFNADYKNFDVSFFFQGVQGRKIYVREWGIAPFRQGSPPPTFWLNAWNGEGTSNTIPHIFIDNYGPNTQVSTWYLQDASYLRLKNLQLGYNIPSSIIKRAKMQALRLYLSGDNLLTFTKFFEGIDPERASASGRAAIYPQAKLYSFGLKATF